MGLQQRGQRGFVRAHQIRQRLGQAAEMAEPQRQLLVLAAQDDHALDARGRAGTAQRHPFQPAHPRLELARGQATLCQGMFQRRQGGVRGEVLGHHAGGQGQEATRRGDGQLAAGRIVYFDIETA